MATQSIPAGYKLVPDDGGIETPMAGGKAEAMAAFLASGGATRGSGRSGRNGTYTKGALKGKTIEEAKQMFEQRWSTASPEIKDKYAARTGEAALAPSEKARMAGNIRPTPTNESLNAALPGETATQMYARQRAERMGKPPAAVTAPAKKPAAWDKDGNGVPDSIQRPASTSATTTAAARGQATPDENARAQAMLNDALGSDKYATADNGGGSMRAAVAMSKPKGVWDSMKADSNAIDQAGGQQIRSMIGSVASVIPGQTGQAIRREINAPKPGDPGYVAKIGASQPDNYPASITLPSTQGTPTMASPAPAAPSSTAAPAGLTPLAQREFNRRSTAAAATPIGVPVISQGQADAYKGPKMGSVNRLTGLPMGFQPGDKIDGADSAMQGRADQSVARQQIAESKAAMAPNPPQIAANISKPTFQPETRYTPGMGNVPVAKPVTDGSEQVSYGDYEAAGTRMKTAGGNAKQDNQDAALRSQFDRQAFQRQADEMRRKREASMRPAYAGPVGVRPVTVGRRS